ncbi:MAG: TetR/AcrR family transcriptional regulator [Oscillospiraceae bacterium]|nr:TetR/AcrR family transcriptional regulator [Oscillospiraceae bacterium]
MDKRIEKTKKALHTAFYQLRSKKSIRDIKVAELCQAAEVNKTTFYTHYRDIFELADEVEKLLLYQVISSIPQDKDYSFRNPALFTREIMLAFEHYREKMLILFCDSDLRNLGLFLEQTTKEAIFRRYPELRNNAELNILLSYCIYGAANTQIRNRDVPIETVIATVEKIVSAMGPLMEEITKQKA